MAGNQSFILSQLQQPFEQNFTDDQVSFDEVDFDYINDPGNARFFGIFIGFLVAVLGATGNGVTIWAYTRNKNLQTSFNRLIANLCCVDFISSAIVIPFMLPGYIAGRNVYSKEMCSIIGYCYYAFLASSLYNLVAIAVNRYVGIVKSKNYQRLFTGRRLALCVISVWVIPASLYLPLVTGGAIRWTDNTLRCGIGSSNLPSFKFYNLSLNIIFQSVPLVVLIFLYTAIFKKVRQVKLKMKEHHKLPKSGHKNRKTMSTVSSATFKNKSGNTSEDTADEYKPSSLLNSSGLQQSQRFYSEKLNDATSDDSDDDDDDYEKSKSALMNDSATISNEGNVDSSPATDASKYPLQRSSILMLLMQKKRTNTIKNKDFKCKMDTIINQAHEHQLLNGAPGVKNTGAYANRLGSNTSESPLSRTKSSSVPHLLDNDVFSDPYSDTTNKAKIKDEAPANGMTLSDCETKTRKAKQLRRCHSTYAHSETKPKTFSVATPDENQKKFWTLRIKKPTRSWASNLSLHNGLENEGQGMGRTRLGTTARKARDKKAKDYKKQQRRNRMLRRKHAREKQLIYSSLTICIAFTLSILPTGLLFLVQVLTGKSSPANVNLVVSCIAWLHSVMNPMIYGYMNPQYRREYTKIANLLTSKCSCC